MGLSFSSSHLYRASLSSVKSNEQMLLSCWSQDDGLSRWQAHPSAEREGEGSSGRRTAWLAALTPPCFSASFLLIAIGIFDIQEPLTARALYPQQPTTHCPVHLSPCQPFCSTDHLPVTCPRPQLEKPAGKKVKMFIIRSTRRVRGEGGEERRWEGCGWMKVTWKVTQCLWEGKVALFSMERSNKISQVLFLMSGRLDQMHSRSQQR